MIRSFKNYFTKTFLVFFITLLITSFINGTMNLKHLSRAFETYGVKGIVHTLIYKANK